MAKRKQPAVPPEQESYLKLAVNGHMLTGEKRGGKWAFVCEDWSELIAQFNGDETVAGVIFALTLCTLKVVVAVQKLAGEGK